MPRKDLVHSWFLDSICWMNKINSCWLWSLIAYLIAPPFTMLLQPSPSPGVCSNSCPWVGDAIETFHPLSPSFPFAFNLSQHQGLFQWVSSSHQMAKVCSNTSAASVLLMNIQGWFPLGLTGLISLLSKGLSRVFSSTTIWKHQFFGAQPSLWSNSHTHT